LAIAKIFRGPESEQNPGNRYTTIEPGQ
jgi:hypothetical protein